MFTYLPFISTFLLILSFRFHSLGWISLISLIPVFIYLQQARKNKVSTKKIFWTLYLSGIIFYVFISSWIIGVKPQLWAGITGNTVTTLVISTWVMVIIFWSLSALFISLLISRKDFDVMNKKHLLLILPLSWSLINYLNSWLFSFVVIGNGGSLGPFWNFGTLGYQIADTPLSYLSRFFGLFGSTAIIVIINAGVFYAVNKKYKPLIYASLILSILSLFSYLIYKPDGRKINVAALQIKSGQNGNYLPNLSSIIENQELNNKNLSIFVIPEGVSFYSQPQTVTYANSLTESFLKKSNGITVAGGESPRDGFKSERIIYRTSSGSRINEQEKNFLIPGGEYSPNELNYSFSLLGKNNLKSQYLLVRDVKKGRYPEYPFSYNGINYGTLSCSGIIAPQLYQDMTKKGANILVDSAELDILRNSPNFFNQTRQSVWFQTIANARPFIQASYGGYSYILDANGNTISKTSNFNTDVIYGSVNVSSKKTIYSRYGEIIIPISIIVLSFYALGLNKKTNTILRKR